MARSRMQSLIAWSIWLVAAVFYSYEFFLRISPTVLVPELLLAFPNTTLAAIGSLSAWYYYAYGTMQIPVGVIFDRFGVKRPLVLAALVVALGCLQFGYAEAFWQAKLARALIGLGSALAFIGCLKIAADCFPGSQFPLIVGLTNTLGALGAIAGEGPLAHFVENVGWRQSLIDAAWFGLILTVLMWWVIKDCGKQTQKQSGDSLLAGLAAVIRCKISWRYAIYASLMVVPIAAFAELWGVPYLERAFALSKTQAASFSSVIFIGIAVGGPIIGWLSSRTQNRLTWLVVGNLGAIVSLAGLLYIPLNELVGSNREWLFAILTCELFAFGFFTSSMLLAFSLNRSLHADNRAGVVVGFTNMLVIVGSAVFQPLVGALLDYRQIKTGHTIMSFTLTDYHYALIMLPICQLAALAIIFINYYAVKEREHGRAS